MKKKQLVDKVAAQFSLKPGKARSAVDLVLKELLQASSSNEGFSSSILNIKVGDRSGRTVDTPEGVRDINSRSVATMHAAKAYKTEGQTEG